ncbi:hypothetical protein Trydic_g17207 [Trypoxylus dichotomus]
MEKQQCLLARDMVPYRPTPTNYNKDTGKAKTEHWRRFRGDIGGMPDCTRRQKTLFGDTVWALGALKRLGSIFTDSVGAMLELEL